MNLSERQQRVLVGTLLGDGCLERNGRWVRLRVDHGPKQEAYARWKHRVFRSVAAGRLRRTTVYDPRAQRRYEHWRFDTLSLGVLATWRWLFYRNGRKIVPKTISRWLKEPIALAVWFMDDGYGRKDCRGLHLNTQAFGIREQHRLQRMLERNFGLRTTIHWACGRPKLYLPVAQARKFRQLVRNCAVPGLRDKLS